jgi:hypothetical protein
MADLEAIYVQGLNAGNHLTGLAAVFAAGLAAGAPAAPQPAVPSASPVPTHPGQAPWPFPEE